MESFVNWITTVNNAVNGVVWGVPALALLIGTGILMTILTKGFQFTRFGLWMRETIGKLFSRDNAQKITKSKDKNSISQFGALCTALSATIGTGNIAGIAYAITMGGPGAVFWMWIAAIVGMMTNFSENVLGIYFRRRNEKGEWCGGAMYYLHDGLGSKKHCKVIGRVLAVLFSIFALMASFGIGNMGQIASIKESVLSLGSITGNSTWDSLIIGMVLLIVAALVILGGIKRIAQTNERIVPFMAIFYIIGSLIIICMNYQQILPAFASIFRGAFSVKAAAGGAGGYVIMQAVTWGFKRGVFSNEAGLGSSVMVHSASDVKEPVVQGMWGIFEVFVDTMIVCTMTALVVLTSGVVDLNTGVSFSGATKLGLGHRGLHHPSGHCGRHFSGHCGDAVRFLHRSWLELLRHQSLGVPVRHQIAHCLQDHFRDRDSDELPDGREPCHRSFRYLQWPDGDPQPHRRSDALRHRRGHYQQLHPAQGAPPP